MIASTTPRTRSIGIAKPMPSMPAWRPAMALFRPTSLPVASTSAPPELPKLIAASVWMKFSKVVTPSWPRPVALTMPCVTVWPSPSGLPIASTGSPTRSRSERPSGMIGSVPSWIRSTARSVSRSTPTSVAGASRPSRSWTRICAARSMTWLLVTMWPCTS